MLGGKFVQQLLGHVFKPVPQFEFTGGAGRRGKYRRRRHHQRDENGLDGVFHGVHLCLG